MNLVTVLGHSTVSRYGVAVESAHSGDKFVATQLLASGDSNVDQYFVLTVDFQKTLNSFNAVMETMPLYASNMSSKLTASICLIPLYNVSSLKQPQLLHSLLSKLLSQKRRHSCLDTGN